MENRTAIKEPFARLFYAAVVSLFWYGVANEYEWTDGAFTASALLSIVLIYFIPLDTGPQKKPALKAYQSDWMLIAPGTNVLVDLTGIPECHRDVLQINLADDGVAVQVAVSGPHAGEPVEAILRVDGGWGTHWAMTQVRSYAEARRIADEENAERPVSPSH